MKRKIFVKCDNCAECGETGSIERRIHSVWSVHEQAWVEFDTEVVCNECGDTNASYTFQPVPVSDRERIKELEALLKASMDWHHESDGAVRWTREEIEQNVYDRAGLSHDKS